MPLRHSSSPQAFKSNVRTLTGEVGKSPHVQSRDQALAIAYSLQRRGKKKQDGGPVPGAPAATPTRSVQTVPIRQPPAPTPGYLPGSRGIEPTDFRYLPRPLSGMFDRGPGLGGGAMPEAQPTRTVPYHEFPGAYTKAMPRTTMPSSPQETWAHDTIRGGGSPLMGIEHHTIRVIPYQVLQRGKTVPQSEGRYSFDKPMISVPDLMEQLPRGMLDLNQILRKIPIVRGEQETATGGAIGKALKVAKMQAGGAALPLTGAPGAGAIEQAFKGPIHGAGAGRTDRINLGVSPGSYVLPADVVSILGQGNSDHGKLVAKMMFSPEFLTGGMQITPGHAGRMGTQGTFQHPKPLHMRMAKAPGGSGRNRAFGGETAHYGAAHGGTHAVRPGNVPIVAAPGEHVIEPEAIGMKFGDLKHGHDILDDYVKLIRKNEIQRLRTAPGPAQ